MAKGAAKETQLGTLHSRITDVFIRVLNKYHAQLEFVDNIDPNDVEAEMLDELLGENAMPNPAMLSAITKFLKDNEISFETEKLAELSDQERRLKERRAKRGNVVSLSNLSVEGTGTDG